MFVALLAVLFIGLKLAGIIAWSWPWVLAPVWLPGAFYLVVFGLVMRAQMEQERALRERHFGSHRKGA